MPLAVANAPVTEVCEKPTMVFVLGEVVVAINKLFDVPDGMFAKYCPVVGAVPCWHATTK